MVPVEVGGSGQQGHHDWQVRQPIRAQDAEVQKIKGKEQTWGPKAIFAHNQ